MRRGGCPSTVAPLPVRMREDRSPWTGWRVGRASRARRSRANRSWWDAAAGSYLAEHGDFLGAADFVWGPEGLTEADAGLLGDVRGQRVLEVGAGAAQCSRWLRGAGGLAGRAGPVGRDAASRSRARRGRRGRGPDAAGRRRAGCPSPRGPSTPCARPTAACRSSPTPPRCTARSPGSYAAAAGGSSPSRTRCAGHCRTTPAPRGWSCGTRTSTGPPTWSRTSPAGRRTWSTTGPSATASAS